MEKKFITKNVCEHLAEQLVAEQAALVKQEAIVDVLMQTLKEKKKEIIKNCLEGEIFKFRNKRVVAIDATFNYWENGLLVRVWFAESPVSRLNGRAKLTRREKVLFDEYKKAFKSFRWSFNEEVSKEIQEIARQLRRLKHSIDLIEYRCWNFNNENFFSPDNFKNSGLYLSDMSCYGDSILIEELKCN